MTNKELYYFACQCLSLDEHPEFNEEIINILGNEENCQNFIQFFSNHWILPTVYLKFRSHNILLYLPEELTEFLAEVHQLNFVRNEQILKQLQEIMCILNEQKIYPTLLKGAGNLVDNIYSDTGERMMGDIDFLVSENEYLLAAELMENAGYLKFKDTEAYDDVGKMKHYPRLYHSDYPAVIEIHRIPVVEKCKSWFNQAIIDSEKKVVASMTGCYVESDHHKIIHNFIHSQIANEGFLYGKVSLRDIYDLYLFSKRFSLTDTLPQIKSKKKAIAYYAFARKAFGLNEYFFDDKNFAYEILRSKHELQLRSPFFHKLIRSIIFISQRVFLGYIGQFIQLFYSKKIRQLVFLKLISRSWYNNHLQLYVKFFRRNG